MAIEEHHVDREAHAEGVYGGAPRKSQGAAGRHLLQQREPEEPRAKRARQQDARAARVASLGEPSKAPREHGSFKGPAAAVSPPTAG